MTLFDILYVHVLYAVDSNNCFTDYKRCAGESCDIHDSIGYPG